MLLAQIPVDRAMHQVDIDTYADGGAAHQLRDLLRTAAGKDQWVTANKLMARKRPHLLPVYDNKVRQLLGAPDSLWRCLWTWFDQDPHRVTRLTNIRSSAGGIEDISLLRCLDIVLWMQATGRASWTSPDTKRHDATRDRRAHSETGW